MVSRAYRSLAVLRNRYVSNAGGLAIFGRKQSTDFTNTPMIKPTSTFPSRLSTVLCSCLWGIAIAVGPTTGSAQERVITEDDLAQEAIYSPYAGRAYADQVFFGEMHFHTDLSFDAGLIGTTLDAHDGFRMARGEKVISNSGQPIQLIRPLDFLVITDHAEMIGLAPAIRESSPVLLAEPWGRWIHERFNAGQEGRMEAVRDVVDRGTSGENPFSSDELTQSIWGKFIEIADQYNEPGRFSAMIGFEWTSTQAAIICTALLSSETVLTKRGRRYRSRCLIVKTLRISGRTWRATSRRRVDRRLPYLTTAISVTV